MAGRIPNYGSLDQNIRRALNAIVDFIDTRLMALESKTAVLESDTAALESDTAALESGKVSKAGDTMTGILVVTGGGDVSVVDGTGYVQLGTNGASNMGIDDNEIQSRDGAGNGAFLGLNTEGGRVQLGSTAAGGQVYIQNGTITAEGDIYGRWTRKFNTTGITAGTGWSVDDYYSWKCGSWLQFRITVTRTGGAVTVPTSGNIGNTTVATLPASERGAVAIGIPLIGGSPSGRMCAAHYQPSNGVIQIGSVGGSTNIATGETFDIGGLVYVA